MHNSVIENNENQIIKIQKPENQITWYFATNQMNLMYILAAGMIMSPKGFGNKYYEDSLKMFPGWILLFPGTVPRRILDMVVKENKNLRPVIAALNLSSIEGPAKVLTRQGEVRDIHLPEDLSSDYINLFISPPLPTSFIESICFPSRTDKSASEIDASDYRNVPLKNFKRVIKKRLFGQEGQKIWPSREYFSENLNVPLERFLAAGGIMAMLLKFGNMGDFSVAACKTSFDGEFEGENSALDNVFIQGLRRWVGQDYTLQDYDSSYDLFWGIIDKIIQTNPKDLGFYHKDIVIQFLTEFKENKSDKYRKPLTTLIDDLIAIDQFGDKNISELLESHTKEIRRALILFFLRSHSDELIEFSHPLLSEADYIAAAILFSARDKWIGLPWHVRDTAGLEEAVSHRMAAMAHRDFGTEINLGSPPPRCSPMRELLTPGLKGWTKKQSEAAICLSRDMKWPCIYTKVKIGRGSYSLAVDGGGVTIVFPGDIKAVETKIEKQKFFNLMSEKRFFENKTEKKLLKILVQ